MLQHDFISIFVLVAVFFFANIQVHYNLDSSFDSQILLPCEIARKINYHPFQKQATTQTEFKPLFPCSLLSVTTFYQLTWQKPIESGFPLFIFYMHLLIQLLDGKEKIMEIKHLYKDILSFTWSSSDDGTKNAWDYPNFVSYWTMVKDDPAAPLTCGDVAAAACV